MKHLRRLIWYAASRLMLITLVLGMMVVAFYYAMNATNIYIVLKDGMPGLIQARHQRFAMRVSECSIGHRQYHSAFRLEDDWRTERDILFGLPTIGGYRIGQTQ